MVVSELVAVAPEGRVTPGTPGLWADDQAGPLAVAAREVAARGSRLALRIGHAGRRGATRPRVHGVDRPLPAGQAWPLLAASAIPYTPASKVPRELEAGDADRVAGRFAAAAARAAAAGVEVLLLDLAHGHLLGGSCPRWPTGAATSSAGRRRAAGAPLRVVEAVRAVWPGDRPLWAALTVTDWAPGGIEPGEAVATARPSPPPAATSSR